MFAFTPTRRIIAGIGWFLAFCCNAAGADEGPIRVLFLGGSSGSHRPRQMVELIRPILTGAGIDVAYTEDVSRLAGDGLARWDVIGLYKDNGDLPAQAESGLIAAVEGGKGLVAIHGSSHCFRNSTAYTSLIGGRFNTHASAVFKARIIDARHPAMWGVHGFSGWDETYLHNELADDNRVLMVRDHDGGVEPYTWVRRRGKGRIYYTALGHDERTWGHAGFHRLLVQAIRWAAGRVSQSQPRRVVTRGDIPGPLPPAESIERMHLPEGLRVELFAAEPDIVKPIAMAFDERGRVWVVESHDYPNRLLPSAVGNDVIKILEDTDRDGRADKVSVFADKLNIPSGIAFGGGGVIVANAPDLLLLRDTDGDDVADQRKVLYTGFGRDDTHAVASNLWYGHDNWMWGCVGYSGAVVKVGDTTHKLRMGLFRFRPDGSDFEVLTATSNNTWGLGFTADGDVLASTANRHHSWFLAVPNRYLESVRGLTGTGSRYNADHERSHPIVAHPRQWDHAGSYTAASNASVYTAARFPEPFRGRAMFVCEPTIHLIHTDLLKREGSDVIARDGWNLLASDDPWCAPTQAMVGPDGAVWFIDWYSYVLLHNKPDEPKSLHGEGNAWFTPYRDSDFARIYRIVWDEAKPEEPRRLGRDDVDGLLAALAHTNMHWRLTSQRLLVERGKPDVLPALARMVEQGAKEEGAAGYGALHALWTIEGLGAFSSASDAWDGVLTGALRHEAPGVRRAVLMILPHTTESVSRILSSGVLSDADGRVRLAALMALSEMPASVRAANAIVSVLNEPRNARDRWIPLGATCAAARSDAAFLRAAVAPSADAEPSRALTRAVRSVAEHYARGGGQQSLTDTIASLTSGNTRLVETVLAGLEAGWPADRPPQFDADGQVSLVTLLKTLPEGPRMTLAALLGRWKATGPLADAVTEVRGAALARLNDEKRPPAGRLDAARLLVSFADDDAARIEPLTDSITAQADPEFAAGMLDVLSETSVDRVGTMLLERWRRFTPTLRAKSLGILLRREAWTEALLSALEEGEIDRGDLSIVQTQQLANHPNTALAKRARKILDQAGRLPDAERQRIIESLLSVTGRSGDKTVGKAVFEKHCMACHHFAGQGNHVGPELTGIAARKPSEILVDILDPNRTVEGNFRQAIVRTKTGLMLNGLIASETNSAFELVDTEGRRHELLRADVDELAMSKLSLMPEGFEKLTAGELAGLLAYLTQRGRYLPIPLNRAATTASTHGMFTRREAPEQRLIFEKWGRHEAFGVPFFVIDPRGTSIKNCIVLYGPRGAICAKMPRSVRAACNAAARAIHLLSGVSGWGYPLGEKGSVTMIVRLHYADDRTEDHELLNGVHFADYIRVHDVPGSKPAFKLRAQQLRYLAISPKRPRQIIREIEFVKGEDDTAPVVMAVTAELSQTE